MPFVSTKELQYKCQNLKKSNNHKKLYYTTHLLCHKQLLLLYKDENVPKSGNKSTKLYLTAIVNNNAEHFLDAREKSVESIATNLDARCTS